MVLKWKKVKNAEVINRTIDRMSYKSDVWFGYTAFQQIVCEIVKTQNHIYTLGIYTKTLSTSPDQVFRFITLKAAMTYVKDIL